ncbi:MAG: lipopolysaccharide transport system ATP-binding protein [Flavobacteriales bacterium]|jgi:lipopolysaccharide transport system ATP-binding protein
MVEPEIALSVKKVSKEFSLRNSKGKSESFLALEDVSFDLYKGEILGIIGANGAGKSTLLKVLSEITTPTYGEVEYRGKLRSILEIGTGFHPDLTGRDNVFLSGNLHGLSAVEIEQNYDKIVEFSGLERFMEMPVKQYSSGMYLRLAFAVAFNSNVDILIIDEVLSVGDLNFINKCQVRLWEYAKKGVSIILVTHNIGQVVEFCHRCLHLEKGKVIESGKTHDVVQSYVDHVAQQSIEESSEMQDESLLFRNVSVNTQQSKIRVAISEAINIKFDLNNQKESNLIEFNLMLTDINGHRVLFDGNSFNVNHTPIKGEIGWYSLECEIPSNLVNRGYYFVGVVMGWGSNKIGEINNLCSFSIYPEGKDNRYNNKMSCVFTPELDWKIEKCD